MARTAQGIEDRRTRDREYKRQWRAEHREEHNAKRRDYYARNREQIRAYQKAHPYYTPEEARAYNEKYQLENAEQIKARRKLYRESHKEQVALSQKKWRAAHPDYDRKRHAKNPARQRGLNAERKGAGGRYTMTDIAKLFLSQGGHCHCRELLENFHIDHIIPISRAGVNWPWNLQLLCAPCNLRKHNRMPTWAEVFQARPMLFAWCGGSYSK